ncbi:UNVERIFIED_CONTAM: hypothetical protein K2H54_051613 [Gekko kuhli]
MHFAKCTSFMAKEGIFMRCLKREKGLTVPKAEELPKKREEILFFTHTPPDAFEFVRVLPVGPVRASHLDKTAILPVLSTMPVRHSRAVKRWALFRSVIDAS